MKTRLIRWGALALGVLLFCAALYYINVGTALGTVRTLGVALPIALACSGLWHLARTWAWWWCFPQPRTVGFWRLMRVRLSAEAFSYLTLRGIAGEPLKIVLLSDRVNARDATAAVAIERLAYLIGTTVIVGIASIAAILLLPLTRLWFRVFRAFAIASAVVAIAAGVVIGGRGTYLESLLRRVDALLGTAIGDGRVARFATAVEGQMLELVRGNPARLAVLLAATVLSYMFMVLEAFVILRAAEFAGPPITPAGAFAVETFSRVASFASAFIPANLGALEASSIAAVAAIGAVGAGAALAVARRLRGLFWAGVGLAIYPRRVRPAHSGDDTTRTTPPAQPRATLLYLPTEPGIPALPTLRLAGLPIVERVVRSALRADYGRVIVWTGDIGPRTLAALRSLSRSLPGVVLVSSQQQWELELNDRTSSPYATAIGAATVVSPALLEHAATVRPEPGEILDIAAGPDSPESGLLRLSIADAVDRGRLAAELTARRARALPLPSGEEVSKGRARLALRIAMPADLEHAEATIRRASYKDTDNKVARFNRRLSLPISIALIRTPLTPNQVSVALVAVGFYSAWLFSLGHYWAGVLGAFLSLAASILDGCDGEIARLKYQESALGCWIETFGDYSYYVAIFVGLTIGAVRQTHLEAFYWIGALAMVGTLLCFAFLIFLRSRITAGRPERLHAIAKERFKAEPTTWSRIAWRLSFTATRSAMPYGIFAFSLVYGLPAIVVLAAIGANVYWVSLVVKLRALMGRDEAVHA